MSQHLTDMDIDRVSLVDKGANGRVFAILKRQEAAMTDPVAKSDPQDSPAAQAGILRKIADWLAGGRVAKAQTFGAIIAGQELYDALDDSYDTLWSALYSAMWACDANGQDLPIAEKQSLVAQSLDEFKAYLLDAMQVGVGKRARPTEIDLAKRQIASAVKKVGAKMSADRMKQMSSAVEAMNTAMDAMTSILDEVQGTTAKRADAQEVDMTADELTAAITKAQEPILARLDAIEKSAAKPVQTTLDDVAKSAATDADGDKLTLEGVAKAVLEIRGDLDSVLKAKGGRTSADGQESEPVKKAATFAGVL